VNSLLPRNYLIEFYPEGEKDTIMEDVYAIDAQEAVYSIKVGWPDCKIVNVYMMINDCWEDEDNNVE
jgi:hypothetical protein